MLQVSAVFHSIYFVRHATAALVPFVLKKKHDKQEIQWRCPRTFLRCFHKLNYACKRLCCMFNLYCLLLIYMLSPDHIISDILVRSVCQFNW